MRGLSAVALAIGLAGCGLTGCGKKSEQQAAVAASATAEPKSVVAMNDPAAEGQLKGGFYGIEGGAWRWTAQKFTVALKPPAGAQQSGAKLHFKFSIPDAVIDKVGPIELSASAEGAALAPERYAKAGSYEYVRDMDGEAMGSGLVTVEFNCDKSLAPSGAEKRELALIAVSAGLEAK